MGLAQRTVSTPHPPADPRPAIARAYRFERARRTLRVEQRDDRKRADRRFWLALAVLIVAVVAIGGAIIVELQQLFGI